MHLVGAVQIQPQCGDDVAVQRRWEVRLQDLQRHGLKQPRLVSQSFVDVDLEAAFDVMRPQFAQAGRGARGALQYIPRPAEVRGSAADCKGKPQDNPFERRTSAPGSAFNVRQIDPRAGSVGDREPCRRAFGSKKVLLNFLSSGSKKVLLNFLSSVIEKILTHLGLEARAPPRTPARRSQLQAACDPPANTFQAARGDQGRGDRLRHSFSEPRFSG